METYALSEFIAFKLCFWRWRTIGLANFDIDEAAKISQAAALTAVPEFLTSRAPGEVMSPPIPRHCHGVFGGCV